MAGERVCSMVKSWQIGRLICCFVLELEYLTDINRCSNYLPILEADFSVKVNEMSKFLNSVPFSFPRAGKVYSAVFITRK